MLWNVFALFLMFCIFVTLIQIIKNILILHKRNLSKYNMQLLNYV